MRLADGFRVAWRAIVANRLRSFLTALGVIIGVAAVILLVSLGQGASRQVTSQVQLLGANLIFVMPEPDKGVTLTLRNVADVAERVPLVSTPVPFIETRASLRAGGTSRATVLQGATPAYTRLIRVALVAGRFLSQGDVDRRRPVLVAGATAGRFLISKGVRLGGRVYLNGEPFELVGILAPLATASFGQDPDDTVIIPVTTAQSLLGTSALSALLVKANDASTAALAAGHLQAVFDRRFGRAQSVRVISLNQVMGVVNALTGTLTLLLAAIAAVSLLVGGIGIMNIMLVSVSERTREIGLRKAVGATRGDILLQFVLEAAILSVSGALLGLSGGAGVALAVGRATGWPSTPSPLAAAIAVGFALAVGIGFGVWPAVKASGLDPIQALRHA